MSGAGGSGGAGRVGATLTLHGKEVPVTAQHEGIDVDAALASKQMTDWVASLDPKLHISKVVIQNVDMFGPRVGFLKFKADVEFNGVENIPGIVFARGGAVAILVILECEGEEYTILTRQPRVAVGSSNFPEIPAGMMDDEGHFGGVAAKELKEETGIVITPSELTDLTALATGDSFKGMVPSAGGCDEFIRLFQVKREVTREQLSSFQGRIHGETHDGEVICLDVVPLDTLWQKTADSKTLCALYLHEKLRAAGKI